MTATRGRTPIPAHGVGLALTLGVVAAGVVIQILVMAPPASGADRPWAPIERGGRSDAPAAASLEGPHPFRAMSAGATGSASGREPARGWSRRAIDLRRGTASGPEPMPSPVARLSSPRPAAAMTAVPAPGARGPRLEPSGPAAPARHAVGNENAAGEVRDPAEAAPSAAARVPVATTALPAAVPAPAAGPDPATPDPAPALDGGRRRTRPAGEEEAAAETPTPEPASGGTEMLVVGPSSLKAGETASFALVVENASDLSHAPVRLAFDPEILEFVEAAEGDLFSAGGEATRFQASEAGAPGLIDIALSRASRKGVQGSGTLCTITLRAKAPGFSSIVTSGSRLLDSSSRPLGFRRNDVQVAVD